MDARRYHAAMAILLVGYAGLPPSAEQQPCGTEMAVHGHAGPSGLCDLRDHAPAPAHDARRQAAGSAVRPTLNTYPHTSPPSDICGPAFIWEGTRDSMRLGWSLSIIGDINNDGWDDLWVPEHGDGPGDAPFVPRSYVYSGSDQTLLFTVEAENESSFLGVATGADLDGDGYDELIFGDLTYDGAYYRGGRLYIMPGGPGPFPSIRYAADAAVKIDGDSASMFGSVTGLGDIDGDTYDDFAVGAGAISNNVIRGKVYVYSGATLDTLYTLTGDAPLDGFGLHLANPGDVNGDGDTDLLIGAPRGSGPGYVCAYTARTGDLIYRLVGESNGDHLSWWGMNGAGDLNQDGYDDIVVGAYSNNAGGALAGRAYVVLGYAGPFPDTVHAGDADYVITGVAGSYTGPGVIGVDDINADGYPDFVVGATFWGDTSAVGQAYLFSGFDGSHLFTLEGQYGDEDFGWTFAAPWDLDGDGIRDLLVGAFNETALLAQTGTARGSVYGFRIGDVDQDSIMWECDNCPQTANPGQEDADTDGHGDICDNCPAVCNADQGIAITLTGDVNLNGSITSADIIYLVNFTFKGGPAPQPLEASGDINCSGSVTSADIIGLVNFTFKGGVAPCNVCNATVLDWACP